MSNFLLFILGFISGGLVFSWALWRDLYWKHKEYFDEYRKRKKWDNSGFKIKE